MRGMTGFRLMLAAFAVFAGLAAPARAQSGFYRGKTISLMVPFSAGGYYDLGSRAVGRHLGRFIPGHPAVVVQNQPGGGGMGGANRLANTAERDGTFIAAMSRGVPQLAFSGDQHANFDPLRLNWLGSLSSYEDDAYLLVVNSTSPVKTIDDLRHAAKPIHLGGVAIGSTNVTFALIARDVLKLPIDIIRGFPGANDIWLAMERGEVDGQVVDISAIMASRPGLWKDRKIRPLIQFGRTKRLPDLADVPTGRELASDPADRAFIAFAELPFFMALPFAAPPGVPADRLHILRTAFMAMAHDKAFLDDMKKVGIRTSPIDGEAVSALLKQAAATPAGIRERFARMAGAK